MIKFGDCTNIIIIVSYCQGNLRPKQTLLQGNSKEGNKTKTGDDGKKRRVNMWKEVQLSQKKGPSANYSSGLPSPVVATSRAADELRS